MVSKVAVNRFCDNCGMEIDVGDRYCTCCGQLILTSAIRSIDEDTGLPLDNDIKLALSFIDKLRTDPTGISYWEVFDSSHGEHKVYPQSQFLLYVLFLKVGFYEPSYLASATKIVCNTDLNVCAVDRLGKAGDRFCVYWVTLMISA